MTPVDLTYPEWKRLRRSRRVLLGLLLAGYVVMAVHETVIFARWVWP